MSKIHPDLRAGIEPDFLASLKRCWPRNEGEAFLTAAFEEIPVDDDSRVDIERYMQEHHCNGISRPRPTYG